MSAVLPGTTLHAASVRGSCIGAIRYGGLVQSQHRRHLRRHALRFLLRL